MLVNQALQVSINIAARDAATVGTPLASCQNVLVANYVWFRLVVAAGLLKANVVA